MKKLIVLFCAALLCAGLPLAAAAEDISLQGSTDLILTLDIEAPPFHGEDNETGIIVDAEEGAVISGAELSVSEIDSNDADYALVSGALGVLSKKFSAYHIALNRGGSPLSSAGKLTITMPVPAGFAANRLALYHIGAGGTKTKLAFTLSADAKNIVLETDTLGMFALAEDSDSVSSKDDVKTGDAAGGWLTVAFAAFVVITMFSQLGRRRSSAGKA